MSTAPDLPLSNPAPTAPTAAGPGVVAIAITLVFSGLFWLAVVFQIFFIVPRFEKIFMDFKLRLPWLTERVMRDTWWVALVCVGAAVLLSVPRASRWIGLGLLILLPLALNLLILVGGYVPLMGLVEALNR